MAGMFIDRMRNAAAQEQAQKPSVAEQVMNPQPPMSPQGMAAAPQARQMPPQARMGQPSPQAMMAARGGMLTIPYDEGDYAEGGIVGFSKGVSLTKEEMLNLLEQQYLAAGSAQERADIGAQIDNLKKMGTVTSPGGQAVTDSQLNQDASFTETAPFAETNLSETNLFGQLKNAEPAAIPGETARQARMLAATGSPYPDVPEMGQLDFQLPAVKGSPGQAVPANRSEIPYVPDETSIITAVEQGKALAQQRIDPNRFSTGTLTEAEARRIEGDKGNRALGAFINDPFASETGYTGEVPVQRGIVQNNKKR